MSDIIDYFYSLLTDDFEVEVEADSESESESESRSESDFNQAQKSDEKLVKLATGKEVMIKKKFCIPEDGIKKIPYKYDLNHIFHFGYYTNISDRKTIKEMSEEGANPNEIIPLIELTRLMYAICLNKPDIVLLLLNYGADPNETFNGVSSNGLNPLAMASAIDDNNASFDFLDMLVAHGADINKKITIYEKLTAPTFFSMFIGKPELIPKLIEYGADLSLTDDEGKTIIDTIKEKDEFPNKEEVLKTIEDYWKKFNKNDEIVFSTSTSD